MFRTTLLLVFWHFTEQVQAQGEASASVAGLIEDLLMPLLLGFLLKVKLVIFHVLIKLFFLGLASLGTSGVSLLVAALLTKKEYGYPRQDLGTLWSHQVPPGLGEKPDYFASLSKRRLYKPPDKYPRLARARAHGPTI